ncbi:hypothetical protein [uncultured Microbacterium sp.]|uniref:Uncharacterized protein n=1 Tax=uncultured Microbacterium sp. TaxID=191216 RepID=A0A1Y5P2Z5_9MICO|nr:hypothetical protein [uncultured Microbacterium sp.]SBS71900.1 hypothetical protein MIPYR_20287 [uncultured Microbacterium sp.]
MSTPDERSAARRRLIQTDPDAADAAERARAQRAAYREQNHDRLADAVRKWKDANRDRARLHNRESMRRAAERKAAAEQRRARGRAWYAQHRAQERARSRAFRRDHPERVREYRRRYIDRHPDRAATAARQASQAWRDRNPDATRRQQRDAARKRRDDDPDGYRRWYRQNLERQRARGREASRLRTRLKQLGLPPRQIHHVYANEKRANDTRADNFFTTRRNAAQKQALRHELDPLAHTRVAILSARDRITGTAPEASSSELERESALKREWQAWLHALPTLIGGYENRHRARIAEEVRMDSVARTTFGRAPYDLPAETARRLRADAFRHAAAHLVPTGDRDKLARLHRLVYAASEGAPHRQVRLPHTDGSVTAPTSQNSATSRR